MLRTKSTLDRDDVVDFIQTANANDLLHILDALINPVSGYVGMATGIENDRHEVLLQLLEDERRTA